MDQKLIRVIKLSISHGQKLMSDKIVEQVKWSKNYASKIVQNHIESKLLRLKRKKEKLQSQVKSIILQYSIHNR